jgi:O-antigen/teichoic acid export membrane protein
MLWGDHVFRWIISAISVAANIALNLWLIEPLGYLGLALELR